MSSKSMRVIADVVLLSLLSAYILLGVTRVPFHGDEATFIDLARDYFALVYDHTAENILFDRHGSGTPMMWGRVLTGSINPLTIGLAADVANIPPGQLSQSWHWQIESAPGTSLSDYADLMWETNVRAGALPSDAVLHVARIPSAIFTALSVVLVFLITRRLTPVWFAAWITAILFATHPAILVNGRRAMQEGSMLFTQMLVMLLALYALRAQRRETSLGPHLIAPYLLLGAAVGLAVAAKHTSMMVAGIAFVHVALAPSLRRSLLGTARSSDFWRFHLIPLIGAGAFSLAVFYMLTPLWWHWQVIALLLLMAALCIGAAMRWRFGWLISAAALIGLLAVVVTSPGLLHDFVLPPRAMVAARIFLVNEQRPLGVFNGPAHRTGFILQEVFMPPTQYYEAPAWAEIDYTAQEIVEYENAWLNGRGGSFIWALILVILFALGCWALAARLPDAEVLLILLLLIGPAVMLWATNPLPGQRYYLMLHAPVAIIAGMGGIQVWAMWQVRRHKDRSS